MDDSKVRILVVDDEIDLEQLMLQKMRRESSARSLRI